MLICNNAYQKKKKKDVYCLFFHNIISTKFKHERRFKTK